MTSHSNPSSSSSSSISSSKSSRQCIAEKRILYLGLLTIISLFITAILSSTFGYILLSNSEDDFYVHQYHSFVKGAVSMIQEDFESRISIGKSLAAVYGGYCPKSSDWPNCWIPYVSFERLTQTYSQTVDMVLISMMPIVTAKTISHFENFTREVYETEGFNPTLGLASGEYGIFSRDRINGGFYHDTTGENSDSPYKVLVPYFQAFKRYYPMLLYNAHSSLPHIPPIDAVATCYQSSLPTCDSSVTDFVDLTEIGHTIVPTTGVYVAIAPTQNISDLVGFISYNIRWLDILAERKLSILAHIDLVISTGVSSKTFQFQHNTVTMIGNGDYHDRKFNHLGKRYELPMSTTTKSNFTYTLTFYPTQQFWNEYHTKTPLYVCVTSIFIVLATSLIFLSYDFFVKREALEQNRILEAKQTYVRFISHVSLFPLICHFWKEIRTPLNIVCLGMQALRSDLGLVTDVVEKKSSISETRKVELIDKLADADTLVADVTESASAAVMVLNDLINYDKIENKNLMIEVKLLSPVALITSAMRTLQIQARQLNVNLLPLYDFKDEKSELYEIIRQDMCIVGDSLKVAQVIRTVVSNALRFSANGESVSVRVKYDPIGLCHHNFDLLHPFVQKDVCNLEDVTKVGSLLIEVRDHGPGMDDAEMSRLFQEGVQFNPNQLQPGQGSGLGLWISKGILELHHGQLRAYSDGPGFGSTFVIEIPLVRCNAFLTKHSVDSSVFLPSDRSIHDVEEIDAVISPPSLRKILIVDDAPTNRKIVRRIFRNDGYTDVDEAKDGLECVEMVSARSPSEPWYDLILMDYEMPRMNGPTATSRLRELGYDMAILGVTGNILSADVDHFIESGANSVLPKPLVMNDLYKAYETAIR